MSTETIVLIAIVAVVVALVAVTAIAISGQRRRTELREQFGPEYEYAIEEVGSRRDAERELAERRDRVRELALRELSTADQGRYTAEWTQIQSRFVDDPYGSISRADRLVAEVMEARGYPIADFEQRASDVSVDHPTVVASYRSAHAIALMPDPTTEQMRQALVSYRSLFSDLLEPAHSTV